MKLMSTAFFPNDPIGDSSRELPRVLASSSKAKIRLTLPHSKQNRTTKQGQRSSFVEAGRGCVVESGKPAKTRSGEEYAVTGPRTINHTAACGGSYTCFDIGDPIKCRWSLSCTFVVFSFSVDLGWLVVACLSMLCGGCDSI